MERTAVCVPVMPCGDFLADGVKGTEPADKPRSEIHLGNISLFFFLPHSKLPVVNAFIIRVPRQAAAFQPMTACHEIDFRCPLADSGVMVFVHILGLDDDLCAVGSQQRKQHIQLVDVVGTCRSRKGAIHQKVGHVRFQQPFRHIDNPRKGIAHEMDRTAGGYSAFLGSGG